MGAGYVRKDVKPSVLREGGEKNQLSVKFDFVPIGLVINY